MWINNVILSQQLSFATLASLVLKDRAIDKGKKREPSQIFQLSGGNVAVNTNEGTPTDLPAL